MEGVLYNYSDIIKERVRILNLKELISQYLLMCELQNNLDKKTLKAYRIDLEQFRNFMVNKEDFCSKESINEYIYELKYKEYAIKTIKRKVASLKAFFSYLNYEDIIEINPFYKIKIRIKEPFVLPKIIPIGELSVLFEYLSNEINICDKKSFRYKELVRDRTVLELLIGTGMRISEVCTLKNENVVYSRNVVKIYGKGSKERIVPIYNSRLIDSLRLYSEIFAEELSKSDYFFVNKRKNRLSTQSVRNMLKKYCVLAKIDLNITPHMFRHTFATMLLDQDVDTRHIQMLLGHSNIMTTQIYTHVTSNKKKEIMKYKNPLSQINSNKG